MFARLFKRAPAPNAPQVEQRSFGAGFTAQVMAARDSYISGTMGLGELTATVQACVSLWEGCFALGKDGTKDMTRLTRQHVIAALNSVTDKKGLTILTRPNGQPMTYRYMANLLLDARKRLGLETDDLHALRFRGVKELAWQGCDEVENAGYSGHFSKAIIRKYADEARQIMRARQARQKRQ